MNPTVFAPGPLAEVDCHGRDDRWTLVFVRDLRHPPEKVWAALTEPAQLRQWAPFSTDRNLGSLGDATLSMIDSETPYDLPASVSRAEPPTLLEYAWGTDLLRWELVGVEPGTRLTLRHTVADKDLVPQMAAGWHLCLVVAEHLLDGRPIDPIRGEDARNYGWEELHEAYAAKLAIPGTRWPDDRTRG
ncbi:MAG TPA: SRPBCC family protein [Pseudonocardiaceae bacterium]|jgi:uncharacterized protein YndB with AHSA1/START domain